MKKILPLTFFCLCLFHDTARAAWRFAWQEDPAASGPACSISSDGQRLWTGPDSTETLVELGVQAEGRVTIRSDRVPFDQKSLDVIGINVDDNKAIAGPRTDADGRVLTFSEEDSVTLHRQLEAGSAVLVTVVFAPQREPVTKRFSLEGYRTAAARYKGCRGLLMNPGWFGLSMTSAEGEGKFLSWLAANTSYRKPGIEVLTVDPRKEARRIDLRPGDRIVGFNGREAEVKSFIRMLKDLEAGQAVELDVVRDRAVIKVTVTRPKAAEPDGNGED